MIITEPKSVFRKESGDNGGGNRSHRASLTIVKMVTLTSTRSGFSVEEYSYLN